MLFLIFFLFFIAVMLLVIQLYPERIEIAAEERTSGIYRLFRPFVKYLAHYNKKLKLEDLKA
ncbi:MAG: hypothetical protein ABIK31_01660 [candidate division WOR-3 bacterium]